MLKLGNLSAGLASSASHLGRRHVLGGDRLIDKDLPLVLRFLAGASKHHQLLVGKTENVIVREYLISMAVRVCMRG